MASTIMSDSSKILTQYEFFADMLSLYTQDKEFTTDDEINTIAISILGTPEYATELFNGAWDDSLGYESDKCMVRFKKALPGNFWGKLENILVDGMNYETNISRFDLTTTPPYRLNDIPDSLGEKQLIPHNYIIRNNVCVVDFLKGETGYGCSRVAFNVNLNYDGMLYSLRNSTDFIIDNVYIECNELNSNYTLKRPISFATGATDYNYNDNTTGNFACGDALLYLDTSQMFNFVSFEMNTPTISVRDSTGRLNGYAIVMDQSLSNCSLSECSLSMIENSTLGRHYETSNPVWGCVGKYDLTPFSWHDLVDSNFHVSFSLALVRNLNFTKFSLHNFVNYQLGNFRFVNKTSSACYTNEIPLSYGEFSETVMIPVGNSASYWTYSWSDKICEYWDHYGNSKCVLSVNDGTIEALKQNYRYQSVTLALPNSMVMKIGSYWNSFGSGNDILTDLYPTQGVEIYMSAKIVNQTFVNITIVNGYNNYSISLAPGETLASMPLSGSIYVTDNNGNAPTTIHLYIGSTKYLTINNFSSSSQDNKYSFNFAFASPSTKLQGGDICYIK